MFLPEIQKYRVLAWFKFLQVLPDLTEGRWKLNGTGNIDEGPHKGQSALVYGYTVKHNEGYGEVVANYTFYVTEVRSSFSTVRSASLLHTVRMS